MKKWIWISILIFLIVIYSGTITFRYYYDIWIHGFTDYPAAYGQMGDFFGGLLNPVLSFASFVLLLYTINIQSKQLNISSEELQATRRELEASRKAQEDSSKSLERQLKNAQRQNFESTFFKLFDLMNSKVHFCFKNSDSLQNILIPIRNLSFGENTEKIEFQENNRWNDAKNELLASTPEFIKYIDILEAMLRLIAYSVHKEHEMPSSTDYDYIPVSSEFYIALIQSSLPTNVMLGLVIYCSGERTTGKLKNFVEHYHFFSTLRLEYDGTIGTFLDLKQSGISRRAFEIDMN
jgi:hypothetical protein